MCPLNDLPRDTDATIREVVAQGAHDPIAVRLAELGFVQGEPVRVVARGPVGGDPLLVQIGYTRFALRRAEAARVVVWRDQA
ncbi:MAG: FeoA domain-containing protein [Nevskia sp.]|nr:FeoA domain-containing protein [Nevskia sp.]